MFVPQLLTGALSRDCVLLCYYPYYLHCYFVPNFCCHRYLLIGLKQTSDGSLEWESTGAPAHWTNFNPQHPLHDKHCVGINPPILKGTWESVDCDTPRYLLCEKELGKYWN